MKRLLRVRNDIGTGVVGLLGDFSLRVPAGSYYLRVYDISTGIELYKHPKPVELKAGSSVAQDLKVQVLRVRLKLAPKRKGQGQLGYQIRIEKVGDPARRRDAFREYGFLTSIRLGHGYPLDARQTLVDFLAPPGKYKVSIWNRAKYLRPASSYTDSSLASQKIRVRVQAEGEVGRNEFTIEVGAPPAVERDRKE